jgi:regulator of nonsense transcripts 2
VNLSKFVSEAVTSICDAKLRTSDIQAAVQVAFKVTN